jgi:deoxycytidine triphosphate deaminase
MKTAIILTDNVKQIVFTPENDSEKQALAMITPDDDIDLLVKSGSLYDGNNRKEKPFTASVNLCKSDYLRIFDDSDSRILVLRPKEKKELIDPKDWFMNKYNVTEERMKDVVHMPEDVIGFIDQYLEDNKI